MIGTKTGDQVSREMLHNYFGGLVNRFFKILPIREEGEDTLPLYMESLQHEILGCKEIINELNNDANLVSLVSILQFMIDNPECPVPDVKREVFRAINICNHMKAKYGKAV